MNAWRCLERVILSIVAFCTADAATTMQLQRSWMSMLMWRADAERADSAGSIGRVVGTLTRRTLVPRRHQLLLRP